ncbi:universal stress protein [Stella sp.]|uniref:universal stress protein n=1 Tax=Stella sp. TaxID=2912054 RepID=UPI0035AF5CBD
MTLRNILVHVDGGQPAVARLELAIALAERDRAHLTALDIFGAEPMPGFVAAELPQAVIDQIRAAARERATATEARLRPLLSAANAPTEWRTVESLDPATIAHHARYCDLAIVGQDDPDTPASPDGIAEAVVMGSGRPVLVVPYAGRFRTVGSNVLVAWDGGREAARAVNDALPLMAPGATVTVLSLNPDHTAAGGTGYPGQDISAHLARHGVRVEAANYVTEDISVGDMLLSRAADLGADLVVMGAYGHSRLRDFVLGGATRHMLAHMTVPVLMSH